MLLFCQCGGVGGVNGDFAEIPFASKPHMVNYHTEGQGENTVGLPFTRTTFTVEGRNVGIHTGPL